MIMYIEYLMVKTNYISHCSVFINMNMLAKNRNFSLEVVYLYVILFNLNAYLRNLHWGIYVLIKITHPF